MACLTLTPPALPPITGGVSLPAFSTPTFSGDVRLCCHFNLFSIPALNIPGIPLTAAALATINAGIQSLDAALAALDILSLSCPIQ